MSNTATDQERNRALARAFLRDVDELGVRFIDKWMLPTFKSHLAGETVAPVDIESYRQVCTAWEASFSNMRHVVHHAFAENDLVAMLTTLTVTHTGEFNGLAPTGRTVSLPESLVLRFAEGKIAEEWIVLDLSAALQQLAA